MLGGLSRNQCRRPFYDGARARVACRGSDVRWRLQACSAESCGSDLSGAQKERCPVCDSVVDVTGRIVDYVRILCETMFVQRT